MRMPAWCIHYAVIALAAAAIAIRARAQQGRRIFSGTGDEVTDLVQIPGSLAVPCSQACGLYMLVMQHAGSGNFVVSVLGENGERRGLGANAIGRYSGSRILAITPGSYRLAIKASGQWNVGLAGLDDKDAFDLPYKYSQKADSGMGAVRLRSGLLRATASHAGTGNFIVQLYNVNGQRLGILVNEIGQYDGKVAQRIPAAGIYYLDVQANGEWSIALEQ